MTGELQITFRQVDGTKLLTDICFEVFLRNLTISVANLNSAAWLISP